MFEPLLCNITLIMDLHENCTSIAIKVIEIFVLSSPLFNYAANNNIIGMQICIKSVLNSNSRSRTVEEIMNNAKTRLLRIVTEKKERGDCVSYNQVIRSFTSVLSPPPPPILKYEIT